MIRIAEASRQPSGPLLTLAGREAERAHEASSYDGVVPGWAPLHRIAEQAARTAEVPMSAISLMKATVQRTVAMVGGEVNVLARADSMCGAIMGEGRPIHVEDVSQDPRWSGKPFVDGRWGAIRFYGAHPLVASSGLVIGTLCVLDDRPRKLEESQVDELDALALEVVDVLQQWRRAATVV